MQRPLAKGSVRIQTAFGLLLLMLLLSLAVILCLPIPSRSLCFLLALLALPPILIYPSTKRWFPYPQAILAICWGFAVLIPWAASQSNLYGGLPLICSWGATVTWTFGFDTVYAMADQDDDRKLGLNSSVLSLKGRTVNTISLCYGSTSLLLAFAAISAEVGSFFWPLWMLASIGMQREAMNLRGLISPINPYGTHFKHQVWLGALILLGLILGRIN